MSYSFIYKSPIGTLNIISDGEFITELWLENRKNSANSLETEIQKDLPVFANAKKWLDIYFSGKTPDFKLPLAPQGTPFRQRVWKILNNIPYGEVITYGDIAKLIAKESGIKRMSAQAIGGAVGHNQIPIITPCHRVIGANGNLTGFAEGLDIKIKLLVLEQVEMSNLHMPKDSTKT